MYKEFKKLSSSIIIKPAVPIKIRLTINMIAVRNLVLLAGRSKGWFFYGYTKVRTSAVPGC
jgi:hypothetical protein